ncbi:MAG: hypothetical protein IAE63_00050, partial [Alphaproteobacteria bacterium]|nr:hypothetical protein [Alphaproteobacteria bacterium]
MLDRSVLLRGNARRYHVPTRSVMKLVIEVPVEAGERALRILGFPKPGEEIPVALARLTDVPVKEEKAEVAESPIENGFASVGDKASCSAPPCDGAEHPEKHARDHKRWNEMRYSQRAGMLSTNDKFHTYIAISWPEEWMECLRKNEGVIDDAAASIIRKRCGVESRAEIDHWPTSMQAFDNLYGGFITWLKYEAGDAA